MNGMTKTQSMTAAEDIIEAHVTIETQNTSGAEFEL